MSASDELKNRLAAARNAIASSRLEGRAPSSLTEAALNDFVSGDANIDQLIEEAKLRHASGMKSILPLIEAGFLQVHQILTCPEREVTARVTPNGMQIADCAFTDPTVAMGYVTKSAPPDDAGWKFWKLPNPERGFTQPLEHVRAAFLNRTEASNVRTSLSHPLRINRLQLGNLPGELGLTFCPGKRGDAIYGGRWDRNLAQDLEVIKAWSPSVVITILEPHEFSLLGVPELPAVMAYQDFEWLHLCIRDSDTPDERFENAWIKEAPRLTAILAQGGRILIHCRGGLGRTGVVAALLLMEAGATPDEAIARVREARPGAIETWEQFQYLTQREKTGSD